MDTDIIERLRSYCTGHPYAKIPWQHRVVHDAIAEIETLRLMLRHCQRERDTLAALVLKLRDKMDATRASPIG